METMKNEEKWKSHFMFKSYYVVWKRYSGRSRKKKYICLNRTM